MSKWNKPQGVVVPLESLLKERRKENCPAPRRSAGLVGRWGITSFTSIRNRGYVVDYGNVNQKDPALELGTGANDAPEAAGHMLGSTVGEAARPRKFFKSRNTVLPPPPLPGDHHHVGFGPHNSSFEAAQGALSNDVWNHSNETPPQHFYQQQQQPLSAATPQLSPTGPQSANIGGFLTPEGMMVYGVQQQQALAKAIVKEKATRKKKQPSESASNAASGRKSIGKPPGKKEKKERKTKRSRKDSVEVVSAAVGLATGVNADMNEAQPKRNSSRIRNRVVNYNEDEEDSNDYEGTIRVTSRQQPSHSTLEHEIVVAMDPMFVVKCNQQREQQQQQDPHVSTAGPSSFRVQSMESYPRVVFSGDHGAESLSGGEGRSSAKPSTTSCVSSPSITEHRPILLRISKGTSMLITDNEELSSNQQQQQQSAPDQDATVASAEVNSSETSTLTTVAAVGSQKFYRQCHEQQPAQHQTTLPGTTESSLLLPLAEAAECGTSGLISGVSVSEVPPPKTELKIKISLSGKPLISSTTSSGSVTGATNATIGGKGGSKSSSKYNFKKRAIERERARHHLSSKRSKPADVVATVGAAGGRDEVDGESGKRWMSHSNEEVSIPSLSHSLPPPPPPVSSSTVYHPNYFLHRQQSTGAGGLDTTGAIAGDAGSTRGPTGGGPVSTVRPSFPLPGTDTYEVFRTLSSLSGGDDFDSQSSILGSASSDNNTPKHTLLAPGEDCQIIHSRGSSDCGSDLELSQNSSTAAAPPSDVYSESENTQDNNQHQQQHHNASTPPVAVVASGVVSTSIPAGVDHRQQTEERVEVLKLNLMLHGTHKNNDSSAHRVTRNKRKHASSSNSSMKEVVSTDQHDTSLLPGKQIKLRVGRIVRNRNNNNNYNVVGSTVSETRQRKQQQEEKDTTMSGGGSQGVDDAPFEVTQASREQQQPESHDIATPRDDSLASTATVVRTGTTAQLSSSAGQKAAVTRQYSRKKKNMIPPDYLVAADTTAGGSSSSENVFQAFDENEVSVLPSSSTNELFDYTIAVPPAATELHNWPNGTVLEKPAEQPQSSNNGNDNEDDSNRTHKAMSLDDKTSTVRDISLVPAVPVAPMRLVLQKKGTIFKSRPLVGSSDGATDTKKRHLYRHKWDDDGVGNSDQPESAGGVGVGNAVGGETGVNGGTTSGGAGGVIVVSSTGGGGGGASSSCTETGSLPASHHTASESGYVDTVGDNDGVGGSNGASGASASAGGANLLEYDNDFFDCESASVLTSMAPRSKRLRTGPNMVSGSGGVPASATGSGVSGGMSGGPGVCSTTGVGVVGHHYHHHEYDVDSSGHSDERQDALGGDEFGTAKTRCERNAKPFYTIVRNVKNSHQMQEIGEFQEMDDDVEYILSALQPDNPVSTRCLSALQLATKCMKPAFKMHVRAHGVVTRFFKALADAYQDASLGLCTAAIMYVFSQDKLNMDLDRDSLELMLNLLDTDHRSDSVSQQQAHGQLQKIRQRVKELCEEIKGVDKTKHIDTDRVTAGSLAMESLLSLTSQRAGEWFKDELRNLGGIEHLIKTVAECYEHVPANANDWNEEIVAKLRKIERCLRVLNNVCLFNRQNQRFLLEHRTGLLVQMLAKMYRQLDSNLMQYPTNDTTSKESIGVVIRELLQPILHMLITLTHSFDEEGYGSHLVGKQPDVINITMHLLLRIADLVPHRCVFDLHLLVLTLLLHLARPSQHNRQQVLLYKDEETDRGGIKALVEYFEEQEEMASHAEAKTNAILETPARTVDAEDAETKLIQKAEHHMEHTYMGSHVCMLIYHLVLDDPAHELLARTYLKDTNFGRMVAALSRYYEFLNLTTNADAESTAHKRQTKEAIDYLSRIDGIIRTDSKDPVAMSQTVGE